MPLPWRSHTVLLDDGIVDYRSASRRPGYTMTLDDAVDLAIAPSVSRSAVFAALGVPSLAALNLNRCAGTLGAQAFGFAESVGADAQALPDCSNRDAWRDSAFYRTTDGDVLFEPTDGGGVFGALGNPDSATFRRAALAAMTSLARSAAPPAGLFLRDVASPDEIGAACVSAEVPNALYSCADTDVVSAADGSAEWLRGELALVRAAPLPLYLDGLASYDLDLAGVHHAVAETTRLAAEPNVAGASCDDCFYDGNFAQLAYEERSAMAVIAAGKRVIAIDEGPRGKPRYRPTPPRARLSALAAIALFYDERLTSFASRSCGTVSGIGVCPETTLVFREPAVTASDPEKLRDAGGAYRRAFGSCLISGVDYGPCVALVNAKPYGVLATGLAAGSGAPVATATSNLAGPGTAPSAGYALVIKGYALPTAFGDPPGALSFHPISDSDVDAATGRVKLAAQSGTILFASGTPRQ